MVTTTATCLLMVWALVAAGLFGTGLTRASVAPPAVGKEQASLTTSRWRRSGRPPSAPPPATATPSTAAAGTSSASYSPLSPPWPHRACRGSRSGQMGSEALHTFMIYGLWPDYNDRDLAVVLPPHQLRHGQESWHFACLWIIFHLRAGRRCRSL
ncbi:uncharacterized protein LOC119274882 isoform X2 [Triticum dicoccoides]|uniref:uncharacterized protein LOC119274882 isoform X2 n=1 Tax=Triticum dicoccoides TaxID=85692 RepID=UPI00188DCD1B|nr:uncharacterized protein LOC119274882 isoform X2 [Triticum dicoccoides]